VSVCGRIIDVADQSAALGDRPDVWCDPDAPTASGACSVAVNVYSALPFTAGPTTTPPLDSYDAGIDGCGRFFALVAEPQLGYLAVAVDDAPGHADSRVLTWAAAPAAAGISVLLDVYTQTHALDAQWTSAAGLTGQSFATRGALLYLYGDPDAPAAGVTITENGAAEPANDYYFADTDPDTRLALAPSQTSTGANGAALKINSALVNHSGVGGDCSGWSVDLAASTPGTLCVERALCEVP